MLDAIRTTALLAQHFRFISESSGCLLCALSDKQSVGAVQQTRATGQPVTFGSLPRRLA